MKKMSTQVHHYFFVASCFFSLNAMAQFDGYPGIKCSKLFSDIESYIPGNAPRSTPFELYTNIKLIVPSLGNYQASQELSETHKAQMKEYQSMLLAKGFNEDLIKKTRVERFELAGKIVDAFVFPDGVVHHVSNPFRELSSKALVSVKDCKINNKDLNCVDEKTNLVKDGFCQVNKDPDMLPLGPACGSDFINEYIAQHNCLIASDMESCGKLSSLPTGVLGGVGGLAGVLYASKKPGFVDGVKKMKALQDAVPDFESEFKQYKEQAIDEFKDKRSKFIDSLAKKYKNEPKVVRYLEFMKTEPRNYNYYYDYIDSDNKEINKQISKDLSKFYEDNVGEKILAKLKKSSNVIANQLDTSALKQIVKYNSSVDYFISDDKMLSKLFGEDYVVARKLVKTSFDQAEKIYLDKAPAEEIAAYRKYEKSKAMGERRFIDDYTFELHNKTFKSIAELRNRIVETQLSKHPLEVRALYENHLKHSVSNYSDIENFHGLRQAEFQTSKLQRKSAMMRKAGLLGAFSGAATEAALNLRNKSELRNCSKRFSLNDREVDFINNEGIFLAAPRIKSTQFADVCDSIYIDDPETTISEAIDLFGGIPNGLCNMLQDRKTKLDASLAKSFSSVEGSCASSEVTTSDLTLKNDTDGQVVTDIRVSRPEGNFVYSTSINGPDSFPDFKSIKVYRLKETGEKELDSKYTQDFKNFFATVVPASQTIDLSSGLEDAEVKDHAKIRAERQKRYNAYMNQVYRSFSESCKGYNNIECDVFGKAQNITPMFMVAKSVCGENKFSPKTITLRRDTPHSAQPR